MQFGPAKLFDKTIRLVEANMDRRSTRHRLIARNLSNVDTPNYQGSEIKFEASLQQALSGGVVPTQMARTHAMHLPTTVKKAFSQAEPSYETFGRVDMDIEMSKLAENNIMFQAMTRILNKKYDMLKTAIAADQGAR